MREPMPENNTRDKIWKSKLQKKPPNWKKIIRFFKIYLERKEISQSTWWNDHQQQQHVYRLRLRYWNSTIADRTPGMTAQNLLLLGQQTFWESLRCISENSLALAHSSHSDFSVNQLGHRFSLHYLYRYSRTIEFTKSSRRDGEIRTDVLNFDILNLWISSWLVASACPALQTGKTTLLSVCFPSGGRKKENPNTPLQGSHRYGSSRRVYWFVVFVPEFEPQPYQ